jgi:type IV secretion system protein TrbJ
MKRLFVVLLAISFLVSSGTTAVAQHIVADPITETETTISGIENVAAVAKQAQQYALQMQQYSTQLREYQNMLQNTVAPPQYVWQQARSTVNSVLGAVTTVSALPSQVEGQILAPTSQLASIPGQATPQLGQLQGQLKQFQDSNFWINQPPNPNTWNFTAAGSSAQKQATEVLWQNLVNESNQIRDDAAALQQLQNQATTADGQMKALQAANELAALQAKELTDVKTLLIANYQAEAARNAALANSEAIQQAAALQAVQGQYTPGATLSFKP